MQQLIAPILFSRSERHGATSPGSPNNSIEPNFEDNLKATRKNYLHHKLREMFQPLSEDSTGRIDTSFSPPVSPRKRLQRVNFVSYLFEFYHPQHLSCFFQTLVVTVPNSSVENHSGLL